MTACFVAGLASLIFFSLSRGGIVFLLAGTLLWFAGLGRAHWSKPLLISFGAIFLAGLLMFLASRSAVLDRMAHFAGLIRDRARVSESQQPSATTEIPLDGRVAIFTDTLRLIRDFPITGTGLGTFRYTFRFYGKESLGYPPAVHPESDWLMLASEAGILAVVVLVVGIGWLFWRVWRLRSHPGWPLRWGILSAALAAFLHGFVDAPAHRTALGWWILVLFVVGLQTSPRARLRPSRLQHLLFIAGGLGALALAVQPFAQNGLGASVASARRIFGGAGDHRAAPEESERGSGRGAAGDPEFADERSAYFQLGVTLLEFRNEARRTRSSPRNDCSIRIRRTSPSSRVSCGSISIPRTATLWLEAVERRAIDAARHETQGAISLYKDLIRQAESKPDLQRRLLEAPARGADFTLAWVETAALGLAAVELSRLAGEARFIASLDETGRRRFLRVWYDRGARPALFEFIEKHEDWSAAAWAVQVRQLVDSGKFEEAVKSVALHHKISLDLPPAGDTKPGPGDEANPAAAFDTYWRRGNFVTARRILDEARRGQGSGDREVWRLSAALAANDGQWQAAWEHLDRCLKHSGLDSTR